RGSTGTSRKIATVERREASVSFFRRKRGRLEQEAARRSWRADPGASPALVRPSALPTPSRGGKRNVSAMCRGRKGKEEDEVGTEETSRKDRRLGRAPSPDEGARQKQDQQHRAAGPPASALDPTYFALRLRAIRRAI